MRQKEREGRRPSKLEGEVNRALQVEANKDEALQVEALKEQKAALRRRILSERQDLAADERETKSARLRTHFLAWFDELPHSASTMVVGLYSAIRGEADVLPLQFDVEARGASAVLPKTDVAQKQMAFYRIRPGEVLVPGVYGILEPKVASVMPMAPWDIGILLIPGVAYSLQGVRLGYGGGYYDRFLADGKVRAIRIGVAFSNQLIPELPNQAHDQAMDYLLTDEGVTACRQLP